jgi:predicted GIY-YIG superfamily endonuclease
MFYVYVLHSEKDSGLYIGYSADLRRRLAQHKEGASQATSFRGPWTLIYYEAYLEEAGRQIEASMSKHLTEFEAAVAKVQTRAGQLLVGECNDRVASIRSELQKDIVLAGAKANELVYRAEQANRHPVMLRWAVLGTVVSLALLVLGLWIGARYLHT